MNRYEEFLEDLDIPNESIYLGSNINILRKEQRISIDDFAGIVNIDKNIIKQIEQGKVIPSFDEVETISKALRISHRDIMVRNIKEERSIADKSMRNSKDRKNYDWYYGSTKRVVLDLIYLICVPILFILGLFVFYPLSKNAFTDSTLYNLIGENIKYVIAYIICSIITGVIFTINVLRKYNYHFVWWHIFCFSTVSVLVEAVGVLITVPYYIYKLVNLIIKKGRNHR